MVLQIRKPAQPLRILSNAEAAGCPRWVLPLPAPQQRPSPRDISMHNVEVAECSVSSPMYDTDKRAAKTGQLPENRRPATWSPRARTWQTILSGSLLPPFASSINTSPSFCTCQRLTRKISILHFLFGGASRDFFASHFLPLSFPPTASLLLLTVFPPFSARLDSFPRTYQNPLASPQNTSGD